MSPDSEGTSGRAVAYVRYIYTYVIYVAYVRRRPPAQKYSVVHKSLECSADCYRHALHRK